MSGVRLTSAQILGLLILAVVAIGFAWWSGYNNGRSNICDRFFNYTTNASPNTPVAAAEALRHQVCVTDTGVEPS
jgi:hypothetical protein